MVRRKNPIESTLYEFPHLRNSFSTSAIGCNMLERVDIKFDAYFSKTQFLIVKKAAGSIREEICRRGVMDRGSVSPQREGAEGWD